MLLVMMLGFLSVGIVLVAYGTFAKNRWGINLQPVSCPRCKTPLPRLRKPQTWRQSLWGGWTCAACGAEVDKWGREAASLAKIQNDSTRNSSVWEDQGNTFFSRLGEVSATTWVFGAMLLVLNIWYDFYHSSGFILDGLILISLFIWFLKSSNKGTNKS